MLKKLSIPFSIYSNSHSLYGSQSSPIHTSTSSSNWQRTGYSHPRNIPLRCFATGHSHGLHTDTLLDPHWPDLPSHNAVPTPYQIFRLNKDSPYSKLRFYELVKIYHPDRNSHESGSSHESVLPGSIKMERYRLIVTAHEILSDPVKRSAYDKSGAGWEGQPEYCAPKYNWGQDNNARWSGFDTNNSPFGNATWEDWERWYQRGKSKQEPVYFSNGGFLMLVLTAMFLGGIGQSVQVRDYSNVFQRQVEKVHDDASKAMRQRRIETQGFGNRDERLQKFLRTRDPHGYGVIDPVEENYRKLLQEPEVCMGEGINHRGHNRGQDPNS